jgi:hypothetical protein
MDKYRREMAQLFQTQNRTLRLSVGGQSDRHRPLDGALGERVDCPDTISSGRQQLPRHWSVIVIRIGFPASVNLLLLIMTIGGI